jgi:hypothetical protein
MLKKAAIVVAVAAAGVLTLSPLAFGTAADDPDGSDGSGGTSASSGDSVSLEGNRFCNVDQGSAGLLGPVLAPSNVSCSDVDIDVDADDPSPPPGPDPEPEPELAVVYSSIPDDLPGNVTSLGFRSYRVSEWGDEVGLEPVPNPELRSLEVVMSSWACQSGRAANDNCVTTPGATFDHPITANIYAVDESGPTSMPGPLLASQTQVAAIPYRPSADPVNCTGANVGQWFDASAGTCEDGYAFRLTITFDDNVPLPDTVIWTIGFNTTASGSDPIGPAPCTSGPGACPYDYLNLGALTFPGAPFEGVDIDPNATFLDSTNAAVYCDGGAGGLGFLRLDTAATPCWEGNTPLGEITVETTAPA